MNDVTDWLWQLQIVMICRKIPCMKMETPTFYQKIKILELKLMLIKCYV